MSRVAVRIDETSASLTADVAQCREELSTRITNEAAEWSLLVAAKAAESSAALESTEASDRFGVSQECHRGVA